VGVSTATDVVAVPAESASIDETALEATTKEQKQQDTTSSNNAIATAYSNRWRRRRRPREEAEGERLTDVARPGREEGRMRKEGMRTVHARERGRVARRRKGGRANEGAEGAFQ
jgi:hypothetical protein